MKKNLLNVDVSEVVENPFLKRMVSVVSKPVSGVLGLDELSSHYDAISGEKLEGLRFCEAFLCELDVDVLVRGESDGLKVPSAGGLVVVSNHPHGMIDGLLLANVIGRVRGDVKILANSLLASVPELEDLVIPVDPFGHLDSARKNIAGMREAIEWVKGGNCLIVFPAGEVSNFHLLDAKVVDAEWKQNISKLIRLSGGAVLPVHIFGSNSLGFQLGGMIHSRIRTFMLVQEMLKLRGERISVALGKVLNATRVGDFDSNDELGAYLRTRSNMLAKESAVRGDEGEAFDVGDEIVEPVEKSLMLGEIRDLAQEALLYESGDFVVYEAVKSQIPNVMIEIGRLRELTFREVGEGSGNSLDITEHDEYYSQLFMWDKNNECVVGGYRIGRVDEILRDQGVEGLYTNGMYRYDLSLFKKYEHSLELGRSFVRSEYQRRPNVLSLIWKGIGAYMLKYPKYRYLFGAVSTSRDYRGLSRDLIVRFLEKNYMDEEAAKAVHPVNPPSWRYYRRSERRSMKKSLVGVDNLSSLISDIEKDGKGIPVLLRHYLKLNSSILSFNVDSKFGNVMDSLILVDVYSSDPKVLKTYMGKDFVENM